MKYFDTDVLVNFVYAQDAVKHQETILLVEASMKGDFFNISWLTIQELGFVLAKLNQSKSFITEKISDFMTFDPLNYDASTFERAIELASQIGFKHFNDCLHTAIAEQNCTELYTYNHTDFKKIKPLTSLTIHIL